MELSVAAVENPMHAPHAEAYMESEVGTPSGGDFPPSNGEEQQLLRPHVGSRVRARTAGGALRQGEVGEIVEDDHSPIPFRVQSASGEHSWYTRDQLEHLATYTVDDIIERERSIHAYSRGADDFDSVIDDNLFDVSVMRFSWQSSLRRERTQALLDPRTAPVRVSQRLRRSSLCQWCLLPRNQQIIRCCLHLAGLLAFVAAFTAAHAIGYRELKIMLERDKYQLRYGRNDGCLATRQVLGVVHTGVDWPSEPLPREVRGAMGYVDDSATVANIPILPVPPTPPPLGPFCTAPPVNNGLWVSSSGATGFREGEIATLLCSQGYIAVPAGASMTCNSAFGSLSFTGPGLSAICVPPSPSVTPPGPVPEPAPPVVILEPEPEPEPLPTPMPPVVPGPHRTCETSNAGVETCSCDEGWGGQLCNVQIPPTKPPAPPNLDACGSSPCQNSGQCQPTESTGSSSYTCNCGTDWRGPNCDVPLRPTHPPVSCELAGTC